MYHSYPEEIKAKAISRIVKRIAFKCSNCGALIPLEKTMPYDGQPKGFKCIGHCLGCGAEIDNESRTQYLPN